MKPTIFLFLIIFSLKSMDRNTIEKNLNDKNSLGSLLHSISMENGENMSEEETKNADKQKATLAAQLIYHYNHSVSKPDSFGKTVLEYAEKNCEKFPKTWHVVQAGKELQAAHTSINNINLCAITNLEHRAHLFGQMSEQHKYSWCRAKSILESYLPT